MMQFRLHQGTPHHIRFLFAATIVCFPRKNTIVVRGSCSPVWVNHAQSVCTCFSSSTSFCASQYDISIWLVSFYSQLEKDRIKNSFDRQIFWSFWYFLIRLNNTNWFELFSEPELTAFDADSRKDFLSHDQILDCFEAHVGKEKALDVKVVSSETVFRMRYKLTSYTEKRSLRKREQAVFGHDHGMAIRNVQPIGLGKWIIQSHLSFLLSSDWWIIHFCLGVYGCTIWDRKVDGGWGRRNRLFRSSLTGAIIAAEVACPGAAAQNSWCPRTTNTTSKCNSLELCIIIIITTTPVWVILECTEESIIWDTQAICIWVTVGWDRALWAGPWWGVTGVALAPPPTAWVANLGVRGAMAVDSRDAWHATLRELLSQYDSFSKTAVVQ